MFSWRALSFRRWRRSKLCDVSQAKSALDRANLFHGVLETILAKLLMLDVLKLVVHLVELLSRHGFFPGWKNDRVFACSVVAVHEHEGLKGLCYWFGVTSI